MQATVPPFKQLAPSIQAYLNFCRVEKGLAANSLHSYQLDLKRLSESADKPVTEIQIITLLFFFSKASVMARPIPVPPPVTRMVFPVRFIIMG